MADGLETVAQRGLLFVRSNNLSKTLSHNKCTRGKTPPFPVSRKQSKLKSKGLQYDTLHGLVVCV